MVVGGSGRRGVSSAGRVSGGGRQVDEGTEAFYKLSQRLKTMAGTGKGSLRDDMVKAVVKAAKPLPQAVTKAAGERFPERGGLARIMAKRTPKVTTRTGVQTAGVRIQDKKTDPRMNAAGRIYHPLFGRKGSDVVQVVPEVKGYFDDTLEDAAPEVKDAVVEVMVDFAKRSMRPL